MWKAEDVASAGLEFGGRPLALAAHGRSDGIPAVRRALGEGSAIGGRLGRAGSFVSSRLFLGGGAPRRSGRIGSAFRFIPHEHHGRIGEAEEATRLGAQQVLVVMLPSLNELLGLAAGDLRRRLLFG